MNLDVDDHGIWDPTDVFSENYWQLLEKDTQKKKREKALTVIPEAPEASQRPDEDDMPIREVHVISEKGLAKMSRSLAVHMMDEFKRTKVKPHVDLQTAETMTLMALADGWDFIHTADGKNLSGREYIQKIFDEYVPTIGYDPESFVEDLPVFYKTIRKLCKNWGDYKPRVSYLPGSPDRREANDDLEIGLEIFENVGKLVYQLYRKLPHEFNVALEGVDEMSDIASTTRTGDTPESVKASIEDGRRPNYTQRNKMFPFVHLSALKKFVTDPRFRAMFNGVFGDRARLENEIVSNIIGKTDGLGHSKYESKDDVKQMVHRAIDIVGMCLFIPRGAHILTEDSGRSENAEWYGRYFTDVLLKYPGMPDVFTDVLDHLDDLIINHSSYQSDKWGQPRYERERTMFKDSLNIIFSDIARPAKNLVPEKQKELHWKYYAEAYGIKRSEVQAAIFDADADESVEPVLLRILAAARVLDRPNPVRSEYDNPAEIRQMREDYYEMMSELTRIAEDTDADVLDDALKAARAFAEANPDFGNFVGKSYSTLENSRLRPGVINIIDGIMSSMEGEKRYYEYLNQEQFREFNEHLRDHPDLMELQKQLLALYDMDLYNNKNRPVRNRLRELESNPYNTRPNPLRDLVRLMESDDPDKGDIIRWVGQRIPRPDNFRDLLIKAHDELYGEKALANHPPAPTHVRTPFDIWHEQYFDASPEVRAKLDRNNFQFERDRYIMDLRSAAGIENEEDRRKALESVLDDMGRDIKEINSIQIPNNAILPDSFKPGFGKPGENVPWMKEANRFASDIKTLRDAVQKWMEGGDEDAPAPEWTYYESMGDLLKPDKGTYNGIDAILQKHADKRLKDEALHMRRARRYYPWFETMDMWHDRSGDRARIMKKLTDAHILSGIVGPDQLTKLGDMTMNGDGAWYSQTHTTSEPELNDRFVEDAFNCAKNLVTPDSAITSSFSLAMRIAKGCDGKSDPRVAYHNRARQQAVENGRPYSTQDAYRAEAKRPATYSERRAAMNRAIGGRRWTATTAHRMMSPR